MALPKIEQYRSKDGKITYRFRVMITGPDGQRHTVRGSGFRSKTEAQNAMTLELAKRQRAESTVPDNETVGEFLTRWLAGYDTTEPNGAQYKHIIGAYVIPRTMKVRFKTFTPAAIALLYADIRKNGRIRRRFDSKGNDITTPLGATTVFHVRKALRVAMEAARQERKIVVNPCDDVVNKPQPAKRAKQTWTAEQAALFADKAAGHPLYLAWMLMALRGLRRGEVAGLRGGDIDYDNARLSISRAWVDVDGRPYLSTGKNFHATRAIELDPSLMDLVVAHGVQQMDWRTQAEGAWMDDQGWLFCWPTKGKQGAHSAGEHYHPRIITEQFVALCKRIGLRPIRLYDLRHTAATLMLASGVPVKVVSEMLGHSKVSTTSDLYFNVIPAMHAEAGAALSNLVLGEREVVTSD